MQRRLNQSLALTLDGTNDFHAIFPHGFYEDAATDQIWVGSGIVKGIDIETDSLAATGHWLVEVHDSLLIDTDIKPQLKYADAGSETLIGIRNTTYGGYYHHPTAHPTYLGAHSKLWEAKIEERTTTIITEVLRLHSVQLEIACPTGMVILIKPSTGTTALASRVNVRYEGWRNGKAVYRQRNNAHRFVS